MACKHITYKTYVSETYQKYRKIKKKLYRMRVAWDMEQLALDGAANSIHRRIRALGAILNTHVPKKLIDVRTNLK